MTIMLPAGHKWQEVESYSSAVTAFECVCGAMFAHDGMDDSQTFEPGDESHEEEDTLEIMEDSQ